MCGWRGLELEEVENCTGVHGKEFPEKKNRRCKSSTRVLSVYSVLTLSLIVYNL